MPYHKWRYQYFSDNSQKWDDEPDVNIFLKELQQLELRIPDKFLEYNGWKWSSNYFIAIFMTHIMIEKHRHYILIACVLL